MSALKKRILLVGDSHCGKSALAFRLTQNLFLDLYEPTGFDEFQTELWTSWGTCTLAILDTSGRHMDGDIRARTYKSCDAVVICFDLSKRTTLESVEKFWLPEMKHYCPGVPIYIAGCKKDIECEAICTCERRQCCILKEREVLEFIDRIGAVAYAECSAALGADNGVEEWFSVVVKSSHHKKSKGAKRMLSVIKKQSRNVRRRFS